MRLLLDTHILIWAVRGELRPDILRLLYDEQNDLFVSAAVIWEIAIKSGSGKLEVSGDLLDRLPEMQMTILPISAHHAWGVRTLPQRRHADPFDRVMVVQAAAEDMTLVTHDRTLRDYGCKVVLV